MRMIQPTGKAPVESGRCDKPFGATSRMVLSLAYQIKQRRKLKQYSSVTDAKAADIQLTL